MGSYTNTCLTLKTTEKLHAAQAVIRGLTTRGCLYGCLLELIYLITLQHLPAGLVPFAIPPLDGFKTVDMITEIRINAVPSSSGWHLRIPVAQNFRYVDAILFYVECAADYNIKKLKSAEPEGSLKSPNEEPVPFKENQSDEEIESHSTDVYMTGAELKAERQIVIGDKRRKLSEKYISLENRRITTIGVQVTCQDPNKHADSLRFYGADNGFDCFGIPEECVVSRQFLWVVPPNPQRTIPNIPDGVTANVDQKLVTFDPCIQLKRQ